MFKLFKKRDKSQELQADNAKFYQAVINKFVTMIDEYAEGDSGIPAFRNRWSFSLSDLDAWTQNETTGRMSCQITAKDIKGEYPDFSEWAHGFGETIDGAFDNGFSNWITTDLPVLIDVIQEKAVLSQEVSFEDKLSKTKVRGILGPMQFWSFDNEGPEPCCNVCIYTEALKATDGGLMTRRRPYLIKAVVARNPDNTTQCDFRINDEQDDVIAAALSEWAKSWEGEGFAMRKQSLLFV